MLFLVPVYVRYRFGLVDFAKRLYKNNLGRRLVRGSGGIRPNLREHGEEERPKAMREGLLVGRLG